MKRPDEEDQTYVDENARIHRGKEAQELLAARPPPPVETGRGIAAVERSRWEEAQRYERSSWMQRGRRLWDDRNRGHAQRFAGYSMLAGRTFKRAIELGCGPFTNMRYILETAKIDKLELLDPLAKDYLGHAFCRYRGGRLGGGLRALAPTAWAGLLHPLRYAREVGNSNRIGGLLGRPVVLHASGIEDFDPTDKYDLVVMINVLEHCRDAAAVFQRIASMLEPGGLFIYADKVYDGTSVAEASKRFFDSGHPLMVDGSLIDTWLDESYDVVMRSFHERVGVELANGDLYFVGRRKVS